MVVEGLFPLSDGLAPSPLQLQAQIPPELGEAPVGDSRRGRLEQHVRAQPFARVALVESRLRPGRLVFLRRPKGFPSNTRRRNTSHCNGGSQ